MTEGGDFISISETDGKLIYGRIFPDMNIFFLCSMANSRSIEMILNSCD